jgi:hypothetical protein
MALDGQTSAHMAAAPRLALTGHAGEWEGLVDNSASKIIAIGRQKLPGIASESVQNLAIGAKMAKLCRATRRLPTAVYSIVY